VQSTENIGPNCEIPGRRASFQKSAPNSISMERGQHGQQRSAPKPCRAGALVQVYGARAYNCGCLWHPHWIAASGATPITYAVYQVIGWNLYQNRSTVPRALWRHRILLGSTLLRTAEETVDQERGPHIASSAVAAYPSQPPFYRVWPGPTATPHGVRGQAVPELA